jgi:hypothetical protein
MILLGAPILKTKLFCCLLNYPWSAIAAGWPRNLLLLSPSTGISSLCVAGRGFAELSALWNRKHRNCNFRLSETGTGINSGSGFGSGSDIKVKVKKDEMIIFWATMLHLTLKRQGYVQ